MVSKTILVVDDEETILSQYRQMLDISGYNVITAINGMIALNELEKNKDKVNLVLLDIMMPGMSGTEVLEKIRNNTRKYDKPKVLVLTNLAGEKMIKEMFDFGADGYLIKTEVDMEGLVKEIEKVMSS